MINLCAIIGTIIPKEFNTRSLAFDTNRRQFSIERIKASWII